MSDLLALIAAYDDAWNRQDVEAISSLHAPDVVFHNHTAGERVEGREAVAAHISAHLRAVADAALQRSRAAGGRRLRRQRVDGLGDASRRRAAAGMGRHRRLPVPRRPDRAQGRLLQQRDAARPVTTGSDPFVTRRDATTGSDPFVAQQRGLTPLLHQRSRRPANARPSVTSSAYSRSPPTGSPLASRVTRAAAAQPVGDVDGGGLAGHRRVGRQHHLGPPLRSTRSSSSASCRSSGSMPSIGDSAPPSTW